MIKEAVKHLISNCANINERDEFGCTVLHYAAENNSKAIAELLISHGANIYEKDDRNTALHIAAYNDFFLKSRTSYFTWLTYQ